MVYLEHKEREMIKQDKKLKELYGSNFTMEVNSGKPYRYGHKTYTEGFGVKSIVDGKVVKEIERIDIEGYIQEDTGGIQNYESLGDLICVPLYQAEYDDYTDGHYFDDDGFVVLDKDLSVVYRSDKKDLKRVGLIRNQNAILKMVSKYGPCALAYLHTPIINDEKFVDLLDKTFDERVKSLNKDKVAQEKIDLEKKQFSQTKEYIQELEKEKENSSIFSI